MVFFINSHLVFSLLTTLEVCKKKKVQNLYELKYVIKREDKILRNNVTHKF